ncbi:MAG: hypothetical protein MJK14_24775 [Rivularia sp. ALOHA_DT_140]|nr:hypothetical protein [Rivularia sp. ALOHA_DT_140]
MQITNHNSYHNYLAFGRLFSPTDITHYFFPDLSSYRAPALAELEFFNIAVGKSFIGIIAIHLLNYGLWTYWIWQGLKRCFRNPNATIFSKQQSYLIFTFFEIALVGFYISQNYKDWYSFYEGIGSFYVWNLFLIVPLFALLLPHRQSIQDWARFRFYQNENSPYFSKNSLISELISGEKSPAVLAIAINLLIAVSAFAVLFFKANVDSSYINNFSEFLSVLLVFVSLMMIYATVAQIMLMLKNSKRTLWAAGTTSALIILPIMIFGVLNIHQSNVSWIFTVAFWFAAKDASLTMILTAFICQIAILGSLNWYLTLFYHFRERINSG